MPPEQYDKLARQVAEIHDALLGTYDHPYGFIQQVQRHDRELYGENGKGGGLKDKVQGHDETISLGKLVGRGTWAAVGLLGGGIIYRLAEKFIK